jgi:hypothetical protein
MTSNPALNLAPFGRWALRDKAAQRRLALLLYGTKEDGDMNHKRKRPKQSRAGCLLCKPNKLGKGMEKKLGHRGFGKLRKEAAAQQDLGSAT